MIAIFGPSRGGKLCIASAEHRDDWGAVEWYRPNID